MTPGQRRVLWACTFAMTFIFWFEASGEALIWQENAFDPAMGKTGQDHFFTQFGYGLVFLCLGSILTAVLQDREKPIMKSWHPIDWTALTIGLGLLAGFLFRSYTAVWNASGL